MTLPYPSRPKKEKVGQSLVELQASAFEACPASTSLSTLSGSRHQLYGRLTVTAATATATATWNLLEHAHTHKHYTKYTTQDKQNHVLFLVCAIPPG